MEGTDSQAAHRLVAGRYRLEGVLGRGGMGVVWRAVDELIGRPVAVKKLRAPEGLSAQERAVVAERALREARSAGRINHPGVVAIHDVVPTTAEDDAVYIVMELVKGASLADVLQRQGALPEQRVAVLGAGTLEALDAAHAIGLVHRDVKPSNILILPGGEVKLVDFGIAHAADDTRLTRHGVAGSTGYMAPELFEGDPPSPASDLWSLGATLFHALKGSGPFDRPSTAATLRAILQDDLPPLDSGSPLSTVIAGLLTRDVAHRMTSQQAAPVLRSATAWRAQAAPGPGRTTPSAPSEAASGQVDWEGRPTTVSSSAPPRTHSAPPQQAAESGRATWEALPTTVRPTVSPPASRDTGAAEAKGRRQRQVGISLAILAVVLICVVAYVSVHNEHSNGPINLGYSSCHNALTFSSDGTMLATDSDEGDINLWDVASHKKIATFGNSNYVEMLQFSPDKTMLAVVPSGGQIMLWDVATHKKIATLDLGEDSSDLDYQPSLVAFSPDSRTVAGVGDGSAAGSHIVKVWNVKSHRPVVAITPKTKNLTAVNLSSDGQTLSGLDTGGTVHLWNVADGRSTSKASGRFPHPWAMRNAKGYIELRDAASGRLLRTLPRRTNKYFLMAWGGNDFLAIYDTGTRIWNIHTGQAVVTTGYGDSEMAASSDGKTLAMGCANGLGLWKAGSARDS